VVVGGSQAKPVTVAHQVVHVLGDLGAVSLPHGKLAPPPWRRDQKLAALAAWTVLSGAAGPARPGG